MGFTETESADHSAGRQAYCEVRYSLGAEEWIHLGRVSALTLGVIGGDGEMNALKMVDIQPDLEPSTSTKCGPFL